MSASHENGGKGLERLIWLKYYIVLKWQITFNFGLNGAKNTHHIKELYIRIKIVTHFKMMVKVNAENIKKRGSIFSIFSMIAIITQLISAIMPMRALVQWANIVTFFWTAKFTLVIYGVELLGILYYFETQWERERQNSRRGTSMSEYYDHSVSKSDSKPSKMLTEF